VKTTYPVRSIVDTVATLCMCAASIAMIWFVVTFALQGQRAARIRSRPKVLNVEDRNSTVSLRDDPILGNKATIALIEYSDFQCPFCRRFESETFPVLARDFISAGKLLYSHRHLPLTGLHPQAMEAAVAAECTRDEGRFWDMRKALFEAAILDRASLLRTGERFGVNRVRLADCIDAGSSKVQKNIDEARNLGIESTPTFLLGTVRTDGTVTIQRQINGAQPIEVFASAMAELQHSSLQESR
jgi:protein-disulfide isomerase